MPAWINAKEGPGAVVMDVLRQPSVRKVLPFVVIFMLLMSVAVFFTSMKPTPYRPLVLMLNDADKQLAIEALKTGEYKPEVDANTGQISVPTNRYQEARMLLASKGLPRTEASGMDNLKDMPAMTTSQFMEQVRYNNAMEQELARSITQIGGIKSARVHLASPKQSVFVRDRATTNWCCGIGEGHAHGQLLVNVNAVGACQYAGVGQRQGVGAGTADRQASRVGY